MRGKSFFVTLDILGSPCNISDPYPAQSLLELAQAGYYSASSAFFLSASSSQAEKELTDSPAATKRTSFPGSSETPLSSKRPKASEEIKSEQVRPEGLL